LAPLCLTTACQRRSSLAAQAHISADVSPAAMDRLTREHPHQIAALVREAIS